jgi:drug/metabolite transporter (DMT)-like permease
VPDEDGRVGRDLLPFWLLAATVFFWGTSYWPTEIALEHTTILGFTALRTVLPALVFVLALPLMGARLPRGRLALWALVTGPLMIALFQWGVTEAVARAGPGPTAVLVNTPPLFVLVLGWIFLGDRVSPLNAAGLPIGFAGVVLMASTQFGGGGETVRRLTGMGLALLAALGWAIGTLIIKWLSERKKDFDIVGFNAGMYMVAAILLAVITLATGGTEGTDWDSGRLWASAVWVGPVNAVGVLFFFLALARMSATRASAALFLVPVVAVLVEVVRGRTPDLVVLAGMILAVVGVAIVNTPPTALGRLLPVARATKPTLPQKLDP